MIKTKFIEGRRFFTLVLASIFSFVLFTHVTVQASYNTDSQYSSETQSGDKLIDESTSLLLSPANSKYHMPNVDGFKNTQLNLHSIYSLVRAKTPHGEIDYLRVGADEKIELGSITQIMTYYVIKQYMQEKKLSMDTAVKLIEEDFKLAEQYATNVSGFLEGDEPTIEDLLFAMILRATGETISALVRVTAGDMRSFTIRMNTEAQALGLKNTVFANAIGVDDENSHTTLEDMALVLDSLIEDGKFREMMQANSYLTSGITSNPDGFVIQSIMQDYSTDRQLDIAKIEGSKTGSTASSGYALLSFEQVGGTYYFFLTAKAKDPGQEVTDHIKLREKMTSIPFSYPLIAEGARLGTVDVKDSAGNILGKQNFVTDEAYLLRLPLMTDLGQLRMDIEVPESIEKESLTATELGKVSIYQSGEFEVKAIAELKLILADTEIQTSEEVSTSTSSKEHDMTSAKETAETEDVNEAINWQITGLKVIKWVLILSALMIIISRILNSRRKRRALEREKKARLEALKKQYKR